MITTGVLHLLSATYLLNQGLCLYAIKSNLLYIYMYLFNAQIQWPKLYVYAYTNARYCLLTAGCQFDVSFPSVWGRAAEVGRHSDIPALRVDLLWPAVQRKSRRLLHVRTARFSLFGHIRHKTRRELTLRHHKLPKRIGKVRYMPCSRVLHRASCRPIG